MKNKENKKLIVYVMNCGSKSTRSPFEIQTSPKILKKTEPARKCTISKFASSLPFLPQPNIGGVYTLQTNFGK